MSYEDFKRNLLEQVEERLKIKVLVTQLEKNNQVMKEVVLCQDLVQVKMRNFSPF